jgi:hypothetical protein
MVASEVCNNSSSGIAAWDPHTLVQISQGCRIRSNIGDGAVASTGAKMEISGGCRIRSNSGSDLVRDEDSIINFTQIAVL